jgi:hypothetical protein
MRHISDEDLFAAMDLTRPGLEGVRAAVERADWTAAYEAWAAYFSRRERPVPLVNLDAYNALSAALRESRGQSVIEAARQLGAQPFDFVTPRPGRSALYGLHYMLWMQPLITAYAIDRSDDHIRTFAALLNNWYENRDRVVSEIYSIDVIWYTLGLAIRSQMFMSLYSAFRHSALLDPVTQARLLKSFLGAARWLHEEHDRFRYGNWQLTAVASLYEMGVFWPEFREAEAWRESGWTRLLEHLELDLYPDGGHSERSPSYQRHVILLCYARAASVAELNGQPLLQDQPRFHALYRWLLDLTTPLGAGTNFNDAHNEWIGKWVVQGAVLCDDPGLKWVAEQFGSPDEIAWSLAGLPDRPDGSTAAESFARLPSQAPDLSSKLLETSKFAIMRTGLGPDDLHLAINYGPLVGHEFESHSHLDTLSFVCTGYGAPLAVEAGLPGNYDDPLYPTWLRQAVAHNMVIVDGADPDENGKEGDLLFWSASPVMDVFEAEHGGYLARGVRHRRTILFVKGEYWIEHDELRQTGAHRLDWRVYTPQPFSLANGRLEPAAAPGLLVIPVLPAAGSRMEVVRGVMAIPGPRAYDGTSEIREVEGLSHVLETDAAQATFLHVLYPVRELGQISAISARPAALLPWIGEAAVIGRANGPKDIILFRDERAEPARVETWDSDARMAWLRSREHWAAFDVSKLREGGTPVFESTNPLKAVCLRPDGPGWTGEVETLRRTELSIYTDGKVEQVFLNGVLLPESTVAGPAARWLMPSQGKYTFRIIRSA